MTKIRLGGWAALTHSKAGSSTTVGAPSKLCLGGRGIGWRVAKAAHPPQLGRVYRESIRIRGQFEPVPGSGTVSSVLESGIVR